MFMKCLKQGPPHRNIHLMAPLNCLRPFHEPFSDIQSSRMTLKTFDLIITTTEVID